MSITLVTSKAILYSEEVYGRNLTLTSRTFAALVALSTFQKRMLLSILYLSNIISNMHYNVLLATLSLPQDKIIFPLDCRLLRKKHIYILLNFRLLPWDLSLRLHGISIWRACLCPQTLASCLVISQQKRNWIRLQPVRTCLWALNLVTLYVVTPHVGVLGILD